MHRRDFGSYSHPKEFWGDGVKNRVNSKGKILSARGSQAGHTCDTASRRTVSPNTPTELFRPIVVKQNRTMSAVETRKQLSMMCGSEFQEMQNNLVCPPPPPPPQSVFSGQWGCSKDGSVLDSTHVRADRPKDTSACSVTPTSFGQAGFISCGRQPSLMADLELYDIALERSWSRGGTSNLRPICRSRGHRMFRCLMVC